MSHLFNGNRDGCVPELSCLLSPSISSYETSGCDPQKYNLQHHQGPYQFTTSMTRKGSLSDEIQSLRSEYKTLQDDLEYMRKTTLDWETRSRICQALNDEYMQQGHIQGPAALLRDKGFDYLPYSISLWAVHTKHESATRFLDKIGPAQWTRYERKASQLDGESVNAVLSVWDALLDCAARDLMVAMWLTRTPPRSPIAYPIPTVNEGISIIDSDGRLSLEEKSLAQEIIPVAVDKYTIPLFTATYRHLILRV